MMAVDQVARMMAMDAAQQGSTTDAYTKAETDALLDGKADLIDGKVPAAQLPNIPQVTVDQTYNAQSANAQSGTAVAQALGTIPSVTVDQTYDATSTNAQSGVAIAGVIGNINSVLEEVL